MVNTELLLTFIVRTGHESRTFTCRQMQEVQQENNSEKHLANLKYKNRQEEKITRYKRNILVLILRLANHESPHRVHFLNDLLSKTRGLVSQRNCSAASMGSGNECLF